ncbi:hypothetical protein WR25_12227 [Diploscapter pachys]|uniref:SOCS box domain-containing protein n=1 Tax=Diploscapter pachys TaxID=2018661 RepID=A0A2A2KC80_9BILA|nr:hypothetical protein WR25_12227 [Diploscapter pachys]
MSHESSDKRQLADKITNYASVDEIRMLLICGAQADGTVIRGLTPLHYACYINYFAAAKLLLNRGAKADAVDEIGCSALHLCAEHGHYRMIKLLLQYMEAVRQYEIPLMEKGGRYPSRENIDEPLRLAIKNGHFECARLLLENGANPNAIYFDGPEITHISPLDTKFIELLLEYGADPNVFDRKGLSPLMRSCRMKEKGIPTIEILLKYGADLNAQAPDRQDHRTALHFALLSGSADLVKFLIGKGAMVNMPEEYEKPSPIDIAVLKDDPELLKVILDAGANPNAVHTYIGSALHLAACSFLSNQFEIVELLLERGADVNLQHKWPTGAVLKSPFVEYFKSRDSYDLNIVKLMLSHGGRVIMKSPLNDSRGQLRNVMRLAVTMTSPQILDLMLSVAEQFDASAISRMPLPENIKEIILARAKSPDSLLNLCRMRIRHSVEQLSPKTVNSFEIPKRLKAYVLGTDM